MPPRDVSDLDGPTFVFLFLTGGPFAAGLLLGAVTQQLRASTRRGFDRVALAGFALVLVAAVVLLRRSSGWSVLFGIPYGTTLLGIMAYRMFRARTSGSK